VLYFRYNDQIVVGAPSVRNVAARGDAAAIPRNVPSISGSDSRRQRMRWTMPYGFLYRVGRTPWDTGVTPPEVAELVEGKTPLPPGRASTWGAEPETKLRISQAMDGRRPELTWSRSRLIEPRARSWAYPTPPCAAATSRSLASWDWMGPSTWCSTWDASIPFHPTDGMLTRRASVR
jgi:hypothetical protein